MPPNAAHQQLDGLVNGSVSSSLRTPQWQSLFQRQFPTEIITYIFRTVLESEPLFLGRLKLVLNLSHVCRAWYNIARATPQLWTGVIVKRSDQDTTFLREWISRSKLLPLDIFCRYYPQDNLPPKKVSDSSGHPAPIDSSPSTDPKEQTPPFTVQDIEIAQVLAEALATRCQDLSYFGYHHFFDFVLETMGETLLGTLTKLQFLEVPPSTCLETIRRSPSLRFLTVEGLVNEGDEGDDDQLVIPQPLTDSDKKMIVTDRLEDLRLDKIQKNDYSNPHAVEQVLSRLELPQLRSALLNLESEFDAQPIVAFFVRSSPPLTDLTLMFDCDNDPDAIELFREVANHLPCLATLSLEFNDSGSFHDEVETVIQFLSDSGRPRSDEPSYSPPFPLLQSLTYVVDYERDTWGGWKFIPTLFPVALANGAPPSLRPLRKFSTNGTLQPSKKTLKKLMAVHRAGIDFCELNDKFKNPVANDHYHGTRAGSGFWEMSP